MLDDVIAVDDVMSVDANNRIVVNNVAQSLNSESTQAQEEDEVLVRRELGRRRKDKLAELVSFFFLYMTSSGISPCFAISLGHWLHSDF